MQPLEQTPDGRLASRLKSEFEALGLSAEPPSPETWRALMARLHALDDTPPEDHDLNLLYVSADPVIIFEPGTEKVLACNAPAGALYGYLPDELAGLSLTDVSTTPEAGRRHIDALLSGYTESPDGWYRFETIHRRRDDTPIVLHIQARVIRYHGQTVILSINRDVTEMQRVQRALANSEERFARIFDTSPVATAVISESGHVLDANDALLDLIRSRADTLIGQPFTALALRAEGTSALLGDPPLPPIRGVPVCFGAPGHDTRFALASAEWIVLGGERSILLQLVDITDQKRVEAELRSSEARYRQMLIEVERQARETALLDQVRTVMAREENLHAVIRAVVHGIRDYFGYELVSLYLLDRDHLTLQHQVGYQHVLERIPLTSGIMARAVRSGSPVLLPDVSADKDFLGAITGVRSEVCVPLFAGDSVVGVLNVETLDESLTTHDLDLFMALGAHISLAIQRARLVSELQLSNERYDSLLRSVQEVVFQTDREGRWVYLNPAYERIAGYPIERMLGHNWTDVMHPDDRIRLSLRFARLIRRRETYYQFVARFMNANGEERWCELHGRLNYSDDGVYLGTTGTASDITERHQAEVREREQRRLAEALVANAASASGARTVDEMVRGVLEHIPGVIPDFDSMRVALVGEHIANMVAFGQPGAPANEHESYGVWELAPGSLPLVHHPDLAPARHVELSPDEPIGIPGLEWVRSAIIAPLRSTEALVGYLYLDSAQPNQFTSTEAQWVQGFADQMGTALHNLRLRSDMEGYLQELELRVTERTQQFRQAKEQVETILNTSSDAIVLLTATSLILQANQAFRDTFGAPASTTTRLTLESFVVPESAPVLREAIRAAMRGTPQRVKLTALRADGSTFPADAALDPLVADGPNSHTVVCSLHDISEHQAAEDSLRAALDQERQLVDLKSRFGIMVSHEFRTPLATIQTSTDLLVNYVDRLSPERRREALDTIARQVRHLTTMLDDILAISKADTIGMDFAPTPTDLAELCQSIAEEVRWLDRGHHQVVYSAEGLAPGLLIDRGLLQRALINLLTNALKYSDDGTTVEFRVRQSHGEIVLTIRDHGIGIPEEELPRLFDSFFRASNVGVIPGTGLGLAIAQRAVEAHGGRIDVQSQPNKGTTFKVRIQATRA